MDWLETIIIAIVEGLTEFLPVSSTGHMIITQNLLNVPQGDPFLVQQNVLTEREVAWYADRLCITPKYLSQVCRTMTGLPASQWIQFYASFELVSLLNDTSKTLSEISDLMNFENISHFSRYVKKMLGKSPSEYRQK